MREQSGESLQLASPHRPGIKISKPAMREQSGESLQLASPHQSGLEISKPAMREQSGVEDEVKAGLDPSTKIHMQHLQLVSISLAKVS